MLSLLVSLLIACLIFGLIWWVVTLIPLPPPFANIVRAVIAIILVIWMISLLIPFSSHPLLR
jgi:hypothetical protein